MFVSMGCSDGYIRLVSIDIEEGTYTIIEEIPLSEGSNDAVLYHDINNCAAKAICGTQEGNLNLVDIETG